MQPSDAHVHVIATGGTISSHFDGADWTNLTAACRSCNARKYTASLLDFLARS